MFRELANRSEFVDPTGMAKRLVTMRIQHFPNR
jgi:hypothetical protein